MTRFLSLCIAALALVFVCVSVVGTQTQTSSDAMVLEGIVVNLGTQEPIPGVAVTATPEAGMTKSGNTDRTGRFTISGLTPGRYTVGLARPGFVRPQRSSGPANLTLSPGESLKDIRFQLIALGAISGHVFDETGGPASRVSIRAVRPQYDRGRRVMSVSTVFGQGTRAAAGTTDENGEYRMFGLEPGDYYVAVNRANGPMTYYPNVTDPADSVPVTLKASEEVRAIDFRLSSRELHAVSFRIVSAVPVRPVVKFDVIQKSRNGLEISEMITIRYGPFTSDTFVSPALPRGDYRIHASHDLSGLPRVSVAASILDKDIDAGTIEMVPIQTISGRFVPSAGLALSQLTPKLQIRLRALDGQDESLVGSAVVYTLSRRVAADGTFSVPVPGPGRGRYQVEITGLPADAYLATARYGSSDVLGAALVLDSAGSRLLELTVSESGGEVRGIAQNPTGETVADSQVVLVPARNLRENLTLFKTTVTDQHGRFSIRGVAPGSYSLLAFEEIETGAWENTEFLNKYESRAVRVEILRGSTSNMNLRVIPMSN